MHISKTSLLTCIAYVEFLFNRTEDFIEIVWSIEPNSYVITFYEIFNILPTLWLLKVLSKIKLAIHNCKSSLIIKPFYSFSVLP
jgi:hypothetical protein